MPKRKKDGRKIANANKDVPPFLKIVGSEYFKAGGGSFARGLLSLDDRLRPDNLIKIYKQFYNRGHQHPHKPKRIRGGNDDYDDVDDDVTETSSRESKCRSMVAQSLEVEGKFVFGIQRLEHTVHV